MLWKQEKIHKNNIFPYNADKSPFNIIPCEIIIKNNI